MTLSTEQSSQTYSGNGVTSTFSVPFPVFDSSHLVVTEINASGNERTLVKDTDYTLSNTTAYQGWIVNLIEPVINYGAARSLPSGYSIRLDRQPPFTQDTDLRNAGKFDAETVEKRFDYLTMLNQRLRDKCDYLLARIGTIVTQSVQAFRLMGATSGYTDLKTDAAAGAGTVNFPAASGTEQVVYQSWMQRLWSGVMRYTAPFTGAIERYLLGRIGETVSIKDFGATGDGVADDTASLALARSYAASASTPVEIQFPAGTYKFSASPNWAIPNLTIRAMGRVVLSFTGTGNAWVFDSPASNLYNIRMLGDFYITGSASATNGLYVRGCHHSEFQASIWNVSSAGIYVQFAIETRFNIRVTPAGLASTVTPVNGAKLDKRNAGERCGGIWYACVFEGVSGDGVVMASCDGPVFISGTSESNGGKGFSQSTDCYNATFQGVWCEANTGLADWDLTGHNNTLVGCRATSYTLTGANNSNVRCMGHGASMVGGTLRNIYVDAASGGTFLNGVGMDGGAGGISGTGAYKSVGTFFYDGSFNFTSNVPDRVGEESQFLPTIIGSTTAGVQTYTNQYGYQTKIGKMVCGSFFVSISAKGGTIAGNVQIGGFPTSARNATNAFGTVTIQSFDGITQGAGRTFLSARISPGTNVATLIESGSGVASQFIPVANLAASSSIVGTYCYLTD